jgi:hypothetical protein
MTVSIMIKKYILILIIIILNVLSWYLLNFYQVFFGSIFLSQLNKDQLPLGIMLLQYFLTTLSLVITGTSIISIKEDESKIKLALILQDIKSIKEDIVKSLSLVETDINNSVNVLSRNVSTKIQEIVDRKYSVFDLHGASKGSLVYYIEPKIPSGLMNMNVNRSHVSLEVLSIDHFQDVLLNEAYIEYIFKRAFSTEFKKRIIVTKMHSSFLHNYLKLCWKLKYDIWIINKHKYDVKVYELLNRLKLDKKIEIYLKTILQGNPVIEYDNNNCIISIKYKNIDDDIYDVKALLEAELSELYNYIEQVITGIQDIAYNAKEEDSDSLIQGVLTP